MEGPGGWGKGKRGCAPEARGAGGIWRNGGGGFVDWIIEFGGEISHEIVPSEMNPRLS